MYHRRQRSKQRNPSRSRLSQWPVMCSCWRRGTKWLFVSTSFCRKFTNLLFEIPKLHRHARSIGSRRTAARTTIRLVPFDWQLRDGDSMGVEQNTQGVIWHKRRFVLVIACLFLLLQSADLLAHTDVTSREQFNRLMPGGLPNQLHYNSDRASLELEADDQNCPASAHGFFELNVNSQGDVTRARDVSNSRSIHPRSIAVQWVKNILMQIHFKPLSLGSKTTSVHTFASVVCQ